MTASAPLPTATEILVVGAGLSGLACARLLESQGVDVHVVEASDAVGGRVRTDRVEGFTLDRGFQVLLTAYEEVQAQVDLSRLSLQSFEPGSLVWSGRALETLGDPFRNPTRALAALRARVGTIGDKTRVARLRQRLLGRSADDCFAGPERSTREELEALGFSTAFIDAFFRPFLGGVFLERDLETSASLFRYYFRCFAAGAVALPAGGMQHLPELLAQTLDGRITLNARASKVSPTSVTLEDGSEVRARQVVAAVDGAAAASLLGTPAPGLKATVTSYFTAEEAPVPDRMLVLDGEGSGPANHVAVVSNVAPTYAPSGAHLVSVSGVDAAARDPEAFRREAPLQLARWFGPSVNGWRHLKTYHIPHALPRHPAGSVASNRARSPRRPDGLIVAGDYTQFGAIQGALLSGRRAAEAVLA
jgi:phytoene dehydrogenase-like protein